MDAKLKIMYQSGGYAGWVAADNGRMVQVVSPTATQEQVRAIFAQDTANLDYIARLNKAWAVQGLTFNNLTPAQ